MIQQILAVVLLAAICVVQQVQAASIGGHHFRRRVPRGAPAGQRHQRALPDFVGFVCPQMRCPPVTEDCEMMEVIAFHYQGGECLGCPYCIDIPADFYYDEEEETHAGTTSADADASRGRMVATSSGSRRIRRDVVDHHLREAAAVGKTPTDNEDIENMEEILPLAFWSSQPGLLERIAKRSIGTAVNAAVLGLPVIQNNLCKRVTCPVAPPTASCKHPGMLDGYLRKQKCISCPACFDDQGQSL